MSLTKLQWAVLRKLAERRTFNPAICFDDDEQPQVTEETLAARVLLSHGLAQASVIYGQEAYSITAKGLAMLDRAADDKEPPHGH